MWIKLDAGTQGYMNKINRSRVPLRKVIDNILQLAPRHPVIIRSSFPVVHGEPPSEAEIDQYLRPLMELKRQGAAILAVPVYSTNGHARQTGCTHLPLKDLSWIARRVREDAGLNAEVF